MNSTNPLDLLASFQALLASRAALLAACVALPVVIGAGSLVGVRRGRGWALLGALLGLVGWAGASLTLAVVLAQRASQSAAPRAPGAEVVAATAAPVHPELAAALQAFAELRLPEAQQAFARYRAQQPTAPWTLAELQALTFSGQYAAAASASRAYGAQGTATDERRSLAECLASFLEARGGDVAAQQRLAQAGQDDGAPLLCVALASELLAPKERRALVGKLRKRAAAASMGEPEREVGDLLALEAQAADPPHLYRPYNVFALAPEGSLRARPVGLELALLGRRVPPLTADRRLEVLSTQAVARSFLGQHREAAAALRVALSMAVGGPESVDTSELRAALRPPSESQPPPGLWIEYEDFVAKERRRQILLLGAVLSTRARFAPLAREYLALIPDESWGVGRLIPYIQRLESDGQTGSPALGPEEGYQAANRELWPVAEQGELQEVLARLDASHSLGAGLLQWLVGEQTRAPLQQWLKTKAFAPPAEQGLAAVLAELAARRELAQALGDAALDASLSPIAERAWELWTSRQWAVVLAVMGRM